MHIDISISSSISISITVTITLTLRNSVEKRQKTMIAYPMNTYQNEETEEPDHHDVRDLVQQTSC